MKQEFIYIFAIHVLFCNQMFSCLIEEEERIDNIENIERVYSLIGKDFINIVDI